MPQPQAHSPCLCSRLATVVIAVCLAGSLSACGVAYTIIKSESKLDRLAVPMTKAEVIDEIGRPDRVLRDDGRLLVWEYSLTARKQWLYELILCPASIWVGGCIFYPFTNIAAEHQREYPYHVVLVNDELCAWGSLSAGASFDAFGFDIWCADRATISWTVRVLPSLGVNWRV